jgi:hypothetical protein
MGVAADFVGNWASASADDADVGTFAGRENRFFPREIELALFGQIDPYARGEVRLEAAEEFEDGTRAVEVGLAEAHLTLLTLPFGAQLKMGLMRTRFGLLNEYHLHDRPQVDSPAVLTRFFGEEGLVESGVELSWVAPLPVFLEAVVGVFNGDNEDAFGRGSFRDPLVTGRLRTFLELGDWGAIQLGVSGATGATEADKRASYAGLDVKYKYTPRGWKRALLTLGGEALYADRRNPVETDGPGGDLALGTRRLRQEATTFESRKAWGFYAWADVQPWARWLLGLRYDWVESPTGPGEEWALTPYLTFMPSEFLRFRLAYKHTDRSDLGSPSSFDEVLFQATFILGAHPAHPF